MIHVLQVLFDGLAGGAGYVIVALSFSLIFGVVGLLNVAQADLYTLGAYAALFAMTSLSSSLAIGMIAAVVAGLAAAVVLYLMLVRRLRPEQQMSAFVATLGLSMFTQNVVARISGPNPRTFPQLIPHHYFKLSGLALPEPSLVLIAITAAMSAALLLWLKYAAIGYDVRAVAESHFLAAVAGVNVRRTVLTVTAVSCTMATLGGLLIGDSNGTITPFLGSALSIKMFIVVLVAGAGSVPGAVIVGFGLGVLESLTVAYVGSQWQDMVGLIALLGVLLVRPQGLLGRAARVG